MPINEPSNAAGGRSNGKDWKGWKDPTSRPASRASASAPRGREPLTWTIRAPRGRLPASAAPTAGTAGSETATKATWTAGSEGGSCRAPISSVRWPAALRARASERPRRPRPATRRSI